MRLFYLKCVPLLTFIFAALVGLIRARPYDDSELHAILVPSDGCALPCFMGIRPGITTVQEAYDLLERHPWVDHVKQHIWFSGPNNNLFSWTWSGQQPAFINSAAPGVFSAHGSLVDVVQVSTTIPLGAFWLRRRPQQGLVADDPHRAAVQAREAGHDRLGVRLEDLHELTVVDHSLDDFAHVVGLVRVVGHEIERLLGVVVIRRQEAIDRCHSRSRSDSATGRVRLSLLQ